MDVPASAKMLLHKFSGSVMFTVKEEQKNEPHQVELCNPIVDSDTDIMKSHYMKSEPFMKTEPILELYQADRFDDSHETQFLVHTDTPSVGYPVLRRKADFEENGELGNKRTRYDLNSISDQTQESSSVVQPTACSAVMREHQVIRPNSETQDLTFSREAKVVKTNALLSFANTAKMRKISGQVGHTSRSESEIEPAVASTQIMSECGMAMDLEAAEIRSTETDTAQLDRSTPQSRDKVRSGAIESVTLYSSQSEEQLKEMDTTRQLRSSVSVGREHLQRKAKPKTLKEITHTESELNDIAVENDEESELDDVYSDKDDDDDDWNEEEEITLSCKHNRGKNQSSSVESARVKSNINEILCKHAMEAARTSKPQLSDVNSKTQNFQTHALNKRGISTGRPAVTHSGPKSSSSEHSSCKSVHSENNSSVQCLGNRKRPRSYYENDSPENADQHHHGISLQSLEMARRPEQQTDKKKKIAEVEIPNRVSHSVDVQFLETIRKLKHRKDSRKKKSSEVRISVQQPQSVDVQPLGTVRKPEHQTSRRTNKSSEVRISDQQSHSEDVQSVEGARSSSMGREHLQRKAKPKILKEVTTTDGDVNDIVLESDDEDSDPGHVYNTGDENDDDWEEDGMVQLGLNSSKPKNPPNKQNKPKNPPNKQNNRRIPHSLPENPRVKSIVENILSKYAQEVAKAVEPQLSDMPDVSSLTRKFQTPAVKKSRNSQMLTSDSTEAQGPTTEPQEHTTEAPGPTTEAQGPTTETQAPIAETQEPATEARGPRPKTVSPELDSATPVDRNSDCARTNPNKQNKEDEYIESGIPDEHPPVGDVLFLETIRNPEQRDSVSRPRKPRAVYLSKLTVQQHASLLRNSPGIKDNTGLITHVKCDICTSVFEGLHPLGVHLEKHHGASLENPFKCEVCRETFGHKSELIEHIFIHWSDDKRCQCRTCGMCFNTSKELGKHRDAVHKLLYGCVTCGLRFPFSLTVREHTESNEGHQAENQCPTCCRILKSDKALQEHVHFHKDGMPYKCSVCDYSCESQSSMKLHTATHFGVKDAKCPLCDKHFLDTYRVGAHIREVHEEKAFLCSQCGKAFGCKSVLIKHLKRHEGKTLKCTVKSCGKHFVSEKGFQEHVKWHAEGGGYQCDTCGEKLSSYNGLYRHMTLHSEEMPFQCSFCGKKFKRKHNLDSHMRTHIKERNFLCKICGERFRWKHNMENHLKTHTGEKR